MTSNKTIGFNKYEKYGDYHWGWYKDKPRYTVHVDRLVEWITDSSIVDIGGGDGLIASKIGACVVDDNEVSVKLSHKHNVMAIWGSAYDLPFPNDTFDAAYIGDTLEHLEFPEKAIKEAHRVVKTHLYVSGPLPGGIVESYEYEASKWNKEQIKENIEKCGFKLQGDIDSVGKRGKAYFYAKFKKI